MYFPTLCFTLLTGGQNKKKNNLAKLGDGLESPTVMVGDDNNQLGKNRGILNQVGFLSRPKTRIITLTQNSHQGVVLKQLNFGCELL